MSFLLKLEIDNHVRVQAPHLFWIYIVISNSGRNFFFYLVVPPIKNLLPSTLLTILKANYGLFLTFSQASLELETT